MLYSVVHCSTSWGPHLSPSPRDKAGRNSAEPGPATSNNTTNTTWAGGWWIIRKLVLFVSLLFVY